jgi:predicted homoserine dehydrogenase-like protein
VRPSNVKIFCLAEHPDPKQQHYLSLYKMGDGPLYPFWIRYHLPHFEAASAIARVVLLGDNVAPALADPSSRSVRSPNATSKPAKSLTNTDVHDVRRGREG